eukprot:scaffold4510_cov183-Amphora_coffeaeformis.AAC.77
MARRDESTKKHEEHTWTKTAPAELHDAAVNIIQDTACAIRELGILQWHLTPVTLGETFLDFGPAERLLADEPPRRASALPTVQWRLPQN